MVGNFEAIGDAVTGGVLGRAAEPRAGEAAPGHTHETRCLNCGAALAGPYCHECGQHAHVHRTLGAFFHDFAHGVLHFEGKIWRTVPMLAWRPGELTRRYIDGQRARFVSPIALFLFSVFLMFGVLSATSNSTPHFGSTADLAAQQRGAEEKLAKLQETRAQLVAQKISTMDLDDKIGDQKGEIELIKMMRERGVTSAVLKKNSEVDTDIPWLNEAFQKARENPDLLIYKLKSNSYKWSWAIIPLSVPFVWLLFPFSRRFKAYDHTVFVTYSVSFMTLLFTAGAVLSAIGMNTSGGLLMLVVPWHMYRQLRGAYGCSRWGAIWRVSVLLVVALLVLTAFIVLMAALGIFD
jgi:hypothetical protein